MLSEHETVKFVEPASRLPAEYRVVVLCGDLSRTHALPTTGQVTVGRSADADVAIDDPAVSRLHARIHVAESIAVEDLGSANGTFVRGDRIAPGQPVALAVGDSFAVGGATLVLQGGGARRSIERAPPHDAMASLRHLAERVAASPLNILLLGETGVGKGVLAGEIHRASPRADKPFVALNCAALPEALLESELFGFERGAFTGALRAKEGLLEAASGGTVLLDEIGETPLAIQAKLLRAIEQREVQRLGALRPSVVDVRFLAATNRDLAAEVERGSFRRDLFYRLNGISLEIPPLRERVGEIEPLAVRFLGEARKVANLPPATFSAEAMTQLRTHAWPGNIRELRSVVERAVALGGTADRLQAEHVAIDALRVRRAVAPLAASPLPPRADENADGGERRRVLEALERFGGNQSRAAAALGMARRTLISRLEAYGVPRPRKGQGK